MGRRANQLNKDLILNNSYSLALGYITPCWIWRGVSVNGYGQISIKRKRFRTHRIAAYLWCEFDLNSDLLVCHKCDVKMCCNPSHLFIGTISDNAKDAVKKGLWVNNKGSRHGMSKLNEDDVLFIRALIKNRSFSQWEIANIFNVCRQTISNIKRNFLWKHTY